MSAETEKATPARRGPRKEADIRAEVEQEMRERLEAEIRAEVAENARDSLEATIRAEVAAEQAAKEAADAKARAAAAEARPVKGIDLDGDPSAPGAHTIHFVEDGLTVLGKVWYRGEELTLNPDTPNWKEAHAVLSLDEFEQEERWGKRLYRNGPWRGRRLDEIDDADLTEAEKAQLAKAEQIRRERYGL